nr:hypothetical protein [Tanacetum cinerariifolium]
LGHVHFKRMQDMSKDGLIPTIDMETEKCERGIECIFVGYAEHSKAFRFYVIEPNDSVAINSITESKDAIFDEHSFSFIPRPSQRSLDDPKTFDEAMKSQDVAFWKEAINDEMDFIMGNNTWVLTDLPLCCRPLGYKWIFKRKLKVDETVEKFKARPLGCKWIFKRKLKVDGTVEKFKARLVIQGFKKSKIDYFDTYALVARISIIRLLITMASIHNLIIHQMDVKTSFLNGELEEEVDLTKEFLSSRFFMKDMGEADVILVSTPLDTCEKLMPNRGLVLSQLEYSRVIGCLMYGMTCTRPDIAFPVGKLSRYTSNPGTQHWQAIQRVLKYLKKTMDYRLASKKQTCITGSTIEYKFMALAAAGKEAEWLKSLLLEIPL